MPLREDDPTIENDQLLLRRLSQGWVIPDGDGYCISAAAFKDPRREGVSVDIAQPDTQDHSSNIPLHVGLAGILASVPRSLGHAIVRDPEKDNPAHALICGPAGNTKSMRDSDARFMARNATIIKLPPR